MSFCVRLVLLLLLVAAATAATAAAASQGQFPSHPYVGDAHVPGVVEEEQLHATQQQQQAAAAASPAGEMYELNKNAFSKKFKKQLKGLQDRRPNAAAAAGAAAGAAAAGTAEDFDALSKHDAGKLANTDGLTPRKRVISKWNMRARKLHLSGSFCPSFSSFFCPSAVSHYLLVDESSPFSVSLYFCRFFVCFSSFLLFLKTAHKALLFVVTIAAFFVLFGFLKSAWSWRLAQVYLEEKEELEDLPPDVDALLSNSNFAASLARAREEGNVTPKLLRELEEATRKEELIKESIKKATRNKEQSAEELEGEATEADNN
ncbi:hypothetical protein Efla_004773 [Eimeria flavescens]